MKKIFCLLIALSLIGCGTVQPENQTELTAQSEASEEVEYIVDNRSFDSSRIIDSTGKTLIDYSAAEKGVVKDVRTHKPAYLYATNYEKLGENEEYGYDFNPRTDIYDLEGNFITELECYEFDTCLGDYYVAVGKDSETGVITNMKTGEVVMENVGNISDGGNCVIINNLIYHQPMYITDYDFNALFDVNGQYDYIYSPEIYLSEDIDVDYLIATHWTDEQSVAVINSEGENILGQSFDSVPYIDNDYLVFEKDDKSYVYDTETLELIMEYEGYINAINDNYFITYYESEENGDKRISDLYTRDGTVVYKGAEGINIGCFVPGKELFAISTTKYDEEGNSFYSTKVIDGSGRVIIDEVDYDRGSLNFIGSDGVMTFINYNYDPEIGDSRNTCEMYLRNGERIFPEREYQYVYQASYNADPDAVYASYAIAAYDYNGNEYYVLLDEKGKELIPNIRSYQASGKYLLYSKGFNNYMLNMETVENVFSERDFSTFED